MSQQIRNALKWLTGPSSMTPGGSGPPSVPPGRNLSPPPDVPPPPSGRNLPPPDVPPTRNLPGPTAPDVPARGNGWGAALGAGAALAAGGGVLGYVIDAMNGGGNQAPPPPQPPAPQPQPPIDPKTATQDQLLAAGFRDYGSGMTAPGGNASGVPDHWRRKMFLKQQAARYGAEIAQNPKLYSDMVAAYDQANTNAPGSAHSARAVATRALTDHLDAQKAAQISVNIQNRAKQQNVASQMGVDRGYVMAMEDVQRHAARGDIASASAAAAMYSQRYGPGFLYAAKNMTDQHSASEKAKAEMAGQKPPPQTVAQSVQKNMAEIQAMPPGPARKAAIEAFYTQGAGGDPKAAKAGVENHYQTIVKDMGSRLGQLSPEEQSELQQVAGHMNYQQFLKYSGAADTPENQKHYQRIFNKNATWAQSNEQLGPLGTVRDWIVPDFLFPGWK